MTLYINYTLEHICFLFKQLRSVLDTMINKKKQSVNTDKCKPSVWKVFTYLIKLGEKQSSHACSLSSFPLSSPLFISNANRKSMWSSLASPSLALPIWKGTNQPWGYFQPFPAVGLGFFVFCGLEKAYLYKWLPYPFAQLLTLLLSAGAWFSF